MTRRIESRLDKAETKLGMDEEKLLVCNITYYADGPLPPERRDGNMITKYVRFAGCKEREDQESDLNVGQKDDAI